ncbi:hypothetical protein [Streptomyces hokutonensis]|uniref:hypothetical protein n=1 Tax=Streptomyces hokutonensis TaxID=1306990 RepID=UPI00367BF511
MAARMYRGYDECRAEFERLCAGITELPGAVHHTSEGSGWVWRLRDRAGGVVAVSARAYERHSTCQAAYERFRALLAELGSFGVIPWDDAE